MCKTTSKDLQVSLGCRWWICDMCIRWTGPESQRWMATHPNMEQSLHTWSAAATFQRCRHRKCLLIVQWSAVPVPSLSKQLHTGDSFCFLLFCFVLSQPQPMWWNRCDRTGTEHAAAWPRNDRNIHVTKQCYRCTNSHVLTEDRGCVQMRAQNVHAPLKQ